MLDLKFIAYYRASTANQKKLAKQKSIVRHYIRNKCGLLLNEFSDISNSFDSERKHLEDAKLYCELTRATLIVSSLDRLTCNLHEYIKFKKKKIKLICCDMPNADDFTLHVMASILYSKYTASKETVKNTYYDTLLGYISQIPSNNKLSNIELAKELSKLGVRGVGGGVITARTVNKARLKKD
jgi:hypothetical protein